MPRIAFDELPDHGRLWIFPATRELTGGEVDELLAAVDGFLSEWSAHGAPLESGRELRDGRFLLVGVDVDAEAPSGCSIDALVNMLRGLGEKLGVQLIDHAPVWYRDAEAAVRTVSRADFRALANDRRVDRGTHVFDTTLTKVGAFRAGDFERPAADSWHGRAFFRAGASA